MLLLLCHLIGDYCLQNHFMAQRKTSSWLWATVHAICYMAPFCLANWLELLELSAAATWTIFVTHLLIDRFRLARYWVEWWGVGEPGRLWRMKYCGVPDRGEVRICEGYAKESAPAWLAVWLLIIVDNTAHLAINYFAATYL